MISDSKVLKVLYISYDGLMEPLGHSQIWSYLKPLSVGRQIYLLTYEKPEDLRDRSRFEAIRKETCDTGIRWIPLRYHKRPTSIATAYDLMRGLLVGIVLVLFRRVQLIHARSYPSSVIALALKKLFQTGFIFDMRGLWADERVDGGLWPRDSRLYWIAKWFERQFLISCDVAVSLTNAAVQVIRSFPYMREHPVSFAIIPTCVDLEAFSLKARDPEARTFTIGYAGSTGLWYAFDPAVQCFATFLERRPDGRVLILNRSEQGYIRERLAHFALADERVTLLGVDHRQVPAEMARMNAAVYFIPPVFSKISSSPTKLAEFLACGVPCLTNTGIGDVDEILSGERVGVVISEITAETLVRGVDALLALAHEDGIRERCRAAAAKHFSLEKGVAAYEEIYRGISGEGPIVSVREIAGTTTSRSLSSSD